MRKPIKYLIPTSFVLLWTFASLSVPLIPETCMVCEQNCCPENPHDHLRVMTTIEWALDHSTDCHFQCFGQRDFESDYAPGNQAPVAGILANVDFPRR